MQSAKTHVVFGTLFLKWEIFDGWFRKTLNTAQGKRTFY